MATTDLVEAFASQIAADHNDWLADLQDARIARESLASSSPPIARAYDDPHAERLRLLSMILGNHAHAFREIPRTQISSVGVRNARWFSNAFIRVARKPVYTNSNARFNLDLTYYVHSRMTRDLTFKASVKELDIEFKANSRYDLIETARTRIESEIWRRLDANLEIPMPVRTESHPDCYELVPLAVQEDLALECLRRNWQLALIVLEAKHKLRAQQLQQRRKEGR